MQLYSKLPDQDINEVYLWQQRLQPLLGYLSEPHRSKVQEALALAYDAHANQRRKSGEPYITHPVEVTRILAELNMDYESLIAGLPCCLKPQSNLVSGYVSTVYTLCVAVAAVGVITAVSVCLQSCRGAHYMCTVVHGSVCLLDPACRGVSMQPFFADHCLSSHCACFVCSGLLHDTVEDTKDVSFEEIGQWFGPAVRRIVEGETRFSKIGNISGMTSVADVKAEDLRQLFLAMSEEVRIIVVKLADRLHNMRTLGSMKPDKQKKIAAETLQVSRTCQQL